MKIKQVAKDDIVIDRPDPTERTFSKEACQTLAQSIENEGLLHEPILRPIKDQPGKYRPITGRNRLFACFKILNWEKVPCKIAPDNLSDEEAKAMEYAENLFRVALDEAQTIKAIGFWRKVYEAKHPNSVGKSVGTKKAALLQEKIEKAEAEAKAKGEEVDPQKVDEIKEQVEAETKPFYKVLMDTLGVSQATATRLARVSRALEPEQIDVLKANKVANNRLDKLALLGDREAVVKAINLIASGMDHDEAIRQAGRAAKENKKPTKEQEQVAKNASRAARKEASRPKKETDYTDDEWLANTCDGILKLLKRKAAFKRDAILYRRMADAIVRFRTASKKPLVEAKGPSGENGSFYGIVMKMVKVAHPRDWYVCGNCNGVGTVLAPNKETNVEEKQNCPRCRGSAYTVKFED